MHISVYNAYMYAYMYEYMHTFMNSCVDECTYVNEYIIYNKYACMFTIYTIHIYA